MVHLTAHEITIWRIWFWSFGLPVPHLPANWSHVYTQSSKKKLIKTQLSIITFPLLQVLARLGVGFARLASGNEAFAKAAGSFDACQRPEPPTELFYLLRIQAVCSPKHVCGCLGGGLGFFCGLPWICQQITVPFSSNSCTKGIGCFRFFKALLAKPSCFTIPHHILHSHSSLVFLMFI